VLAAGENPGVPETLPCPAPEVRGHFDRAKEPTGRIMAKKLDSFFEPSHLIVVTPFRG